MNTTLPTRALPTPFTVAQLLAARLVNEKGLAAQHDSDHRALVRQSQMDSMWESKS